VRKFPSEKFGRQRLQFFPAPYRAPLRAFAALVFPWVDDQLLLCNIQDRGWTIPSGRVEPAESSSEAAEREALEEAGAILQDMQYVGCYRVTERGDVRWADVFTARVAGLVEIAAGSESLGRRLVRIEDVPQTYHMWGPLLAEVCGQAREVILRRIQAG
jgi:8-oxo-dGTP diphosphatase